MWHELWRSSLQLSTHSGTHSTLFLAQDTYPSSVYYEERLDSTPHTPGVVYIRNPHASTLNNEWILFCNLVGANGTETNFTFGVRPGGKIFHVAWPILIKDDYANAFHVQNNQTTVFTMCASWLMALFSGMDKCQNYVLCACMCVRVWIFVNVITLLIHVMTELYRLILLRNMYGMG